MQKVKIIAGYARDIFAIYGIRQLKEEEAGRYRQAVKSLGQKGRHVDQ